MSTDRFSEKDIAFHRATAESYDAQITAAYGVYHRYMLDPFLDRIGQTRTTIKALDLGCGTGVVSLAMAKRGFAVTGLDHSTEMLEIARRKLVEADLRGRCTFVVGDVRHIPAEPDEFDCVTCQGLLHHLAEMGSCLTELNRVLRPGGFFYISEPTQCPTPLRRLLRLLARASRAGRPVAVPDEPETVEEPIDVGELQKLLTRLGLSYRVQFLTHLPPLQRALREEAYVRVVRAASWPWRTRQGDLVFVFGRKPI